MTLKSSNPWAPAISAEVDVPNGATIDVRPLAFIDSADPVIAIIQQPVNGVATPIGNGEIELVLSQEGADEARYTLEDTRGTVSAPAILSLTGVTEADPGGGGGTPDEDLLALPAATGTTVTSDGSLSADLAAASAGEHVLLPSGSYAGRGITVPTGVYLVAQDKNNPPTFTGLTQLYGNGQVWGVKFTNPGAGNLARNVRLETFTGTMAYCEFAFEGYALEWRQSAAVGVRIHRCFFDGINGNGTCIAKLGVTGMGPGNYSALVDNCFARDVTSSRETVSGKGGGAILRRIHFDNCREVASRHADNMTFDRLRHTNPVSNDLVTTGDGDVVKNCVGFDIEIWRGNIANTADDDGGSIYAVSKNVTVQQITGNVFVGVYPFGDAGLGSIQVSNINVADVSGAVSSPTGATWGTAATIAAEAPPVFTPADVGPAAMQIA